MFTKPADLNRFEIYPNSLMPAFLAHYSGGTIKASKNEFIIEYYKPEWKKI